MPVPSPRRSPCGRVFRGVRGLSGDVLGLLRPNSLENGARSIVVIETTLGPTRFATSRNARERLRA